MSNYSSNLTPDSTTEIEGYIKHISGLALQHDLRQPATALGRYLGDLVDYFDDNPSKRSKLKISFTTYASLLQNIDTERMRTLISLEKFKSLVKSNKRYENIITDDIVSVINRSINNLNTFSIKLMALTVETGDREIIQLCINIKNRAERITLQFQGLISLFNFVKVPTAQMIDLYQIGNRAASSTKDYHRNTSIKSIRISGNAETKGSEEQIFLLLQNLISNAVRFARFNKNPRVKLSLAHYSYNRLRNKYPFYLGELEARGEWVEICVIDNGPGIKHELIENIFKLYKSYEPESDTTDSEPYGTGIGLSVARLIAMMHRGYLFYDHGNPRSTNFVTVLPTKATYGIDRDLIITRELARK